MPKKLTKPQMRVAIAQDVIEQIHAQQYRGQRGNYVLNGGFASNCRISDSVDSMCGVCAIGGMMLSRFRLFNKEDANCWDGAAMRSILSSVFGKRQIATIEAAFECWDKEKMRGNKLGQGSPAPNWCIDIGNSTDRLLAIMQNIVDHGEFRPDVEYEVK